MAAAHQIAEVVRPVVPVIMLPAALCREAVEQEVNEMVPPAVPGLEHVELVVEQVAAEPQLVMEATAVLAGAQAVIVAMVALVVDGTHCRLQALAGEEEAGLWLAEDNVLLGAAALDYWGQAATGLSAHYQVLTHLSGAAVVVAQQAEIAQLTVLVELVAHMAAVVVPVRPLVVEKEAGLAPGWLMVII